MFACSDAKMVACLHACMFTDVTLRHIAARTSTSDRMSPLTRGAGVSVHSQLSRSRSATLSGIFETSQPLNDDAFFSPVVGKVAELLPRRCVPLSLFLCQCVSSLHLFSISSSNERLVSNDEGCSKV